MPAYIYMGIHFSGSISTVSYYFGQTVHSLKALGRSIDKLLSIRGRYRPSTSHKDNLEYWSGHDQDILFTLESQTNRTEV